MNEQIDSNPSLRNESSDFPIGVKTGYSSFIGNSLNMNFVNPIERKFQSFQNQDIRSQMPLYDFNLSQIVKIHKENINVLNQQLESNQIFLSMVVHDMRSPTVSVKLAFERLLELIRKTSEDLLNKNPGEQLPMFGDAGGSNLQLNFV